MPRKTYGKYTVLAVIMLGQVIGPLDGSMLGVALPTIGEDLDIGISAVGWVMVAYLLMTCSLMIIFGRVGDVVGRRKIFVWGLFLFSAGSVLWGLSVNYTMLLATRALQGLGGAMFSSNLPALVTSAFPAEERGKALGMTATAVAAALAVGPLLGGLITGTLGWRFVFFVGPPFGIAAAVLSLKIVPESKLATGESLDVAGALLLLGALSPLVLALSQGRIWGWGSPQVIGLFAVAVILAFIFVLHERKARHPIIDLELFKIPAFTLSNLASFSTYNAMQVVGFATPFFLQYSMGMAPQRVGLVMGISNIVALFLLSTSGRLSDRIGSTPLETAGMALFIISLALLAWAGGGLTLLLIIIGLVVMGLGYGVFRSPNYSAVMGSVPAGRLGVAGGVNGTMRTMGFMTGIAVAGSVMGSWAARRPDAVAYTNTAFEAAVRNAYIAGFIVVVAGLLLVLLKYHFRKS
ncbi:MAG: MFS transporter [Actinobacteria bacterium]|nr:MFS transporter [Actinomycetota bacterium]